VTDYMKLASDYVAEHGRYSNAKVPPAKPYMVRWPLASGRFITSDDTYDLAKKVAKAMKRWDEARNL